MSRSRPRWADADVPLALLVVVVLVLAFVLPGLLSDPDPESAPVAPRADGPTPPSTSPTAQGVLPASPVTPGAPSEPQPTNPAPQAPPALARPAAPGTCVEVPGPRLTTASFNIHSGFNRDRSRVALDQIAGEIEALSADVVLLQEVDRNRRWTGGVDQSQYLADRLGMHHAFGPNVRRAGNRDYGTAILSRYPITGAENTLLPNGPGGQQRGLLHVEVAPFGDPVSLYTTHLEHTSGALRSAQARRIAEIMAQDPVPKVLGGDLNATPGSDVLGTLEGPLDDSWTAAGTGPGYTHPSGVPRSRIDYLLYGGGLRPAESVVVPSAVSDHQALRTVFEVGEPTEVCVPLF
jgi:endonuclease/exonuclease/phosphatase family metal-dependent hydrolase